MVEYDTKRMKFLGIITFLLLVFSLMVGNAYKYLPENLSDASNTVEKQTELKSDLQSNVVNVSEEEPEIKAESKIVAKERQDADAEIPVAYKRSEVTQKFTELETISFEEISPEETSPKSGTVNNNAEEFSKAEEFKSNQDYVNAIKEYQRILNSTQDVKKRAQCYEEISRIYGIDKRYGSALSYAQKAYNLYPTTNREVLLARLYYKTGDIDKATNRINNVLKRDFWADR